MWWIRAVGSIVILVAVGQSHLIGQVWTPAGSDVFAGSPVSVAEGGVQLIPWAADPGYASAGRPSVASGLFVVGDAPPHASTWSGHRVGVSGTVGGGGVSVGVGTLNVGFDYVRPLWTSLHFLEPIPSGFEEFFGPVGNIQHIDDAFGFMPTVQYNYKVENPNLNVNTSGKFLNLSGKIDRNYTDGTGSGELTGTSRLTLVTANIIEATRRVSFEELLGRPPHKPGHDDVCFEFGIGTRYSSIEQNVDINVTFRSDVTRSNRRHAEQTFRGIGLTGIANILNPVGPNLDLFMNNRASILVGENSKYSSLDLNVADQPNGVVNTSIKQTRTVYLPIFESELGVGWVGAVDVWPHATEVAPPLLTLRAAIVGQFWGDVGPLSAGQQSFSSSSLFLVGVSVTIGITR
jgi:hypothetical protein